MLWVTPDATKPQSAPPTPKQQFPFSLGPGNGVYAGSGCEYPVSPSSQRKGLDTVYDQGLWSLTSLAIPSAGALSSHLQHWVNCANQMREFT